jgi:hypothetical protein
LLLFVFPCLIISLSLSSTTGKAKHGGRIRLR